MDPDSLVLKKHYQYIKDITLSDSNTEDILTMVCETTRGVFTDSEEKEFIQNKLKEDDSFIVLDDFMEAKIGVCTHHALLNAYILSRLIDDGFLKGQVIHYQQQLNDRTHVWNLFIDEQDGNRYSLDSLLRDVTSITEKPGALDKLYRSKVEAKINKLFPPNATIKSPQETLQQKAHAILNNIANYIELNSFVVASYILFSGGVDITLPNSGKKRVPHRIADIYQLITQGQTHGQEEHLLKQVKKIARDALANPRTTQDIKTKEFYKQITEDKVLELISTSQKPSGQNTL